MNDPTYHRAPAYAPQKLMGSNVTIKPISDEICAACGEPIDVQPGETFTASTDGKVWHLGCSPSRTRPTLVTGQSQEDGGELVERAFHTEILDWTGEAARLSLDAADRPPVKRSTLGGGIQHAAWMLTEIEERRIIGNKAHRWLGYAQGLLVENGYLTLEEAKDANKIASEASAAIAATRAKTQTPTPGLTDDVVKELVEALSECQDKLWVIHFSLKDKAEREAAIRACNMATDALAKARTGVTLNG